MDAHALLTSQGWRGTGHSLHATSDAIGLAKPLLLNRRDGNKGLGQKPHYTSDTWWMNAFDEQLQGLKSSSNGGSGTTGGNDDAVMGIVQTVTEGRINKVEKGMAGGKWKLAGNFVMGGVLDGTVDLLGGEGDSSSSDDEEEGEGGSSNGVGSGSGTAVSMPPATEKETLKRVSKEENKDERKRRRKTEKAERAERGAKTARKAERTARRERRREEKAAKKKKGADGEKKEKKMAKKMKKDVKGVGSEVAAARTKVLSAEKLTDPCKKSKRDETKEERRERRVAKTLRREARAARKSS